MPPKRAVARVTVAKAKKAKATVVSNGHIERAAEEHVEMVASSVKASVNEPPRPIVSCEEGRKRIYKAGTNEFKICCWNLNGIRSTLRPHPAFSGASPLQQYVSEEGPDILCVNETKIHDTQVHDFCNVLPGYKGYFVGSQKKGYAGVATFIRDGVKAVLQKKGLGHATHDAEGRVQTFLVTPGKGLPSFYLVNTYVVNAGRGLVRLDYKIKTFNKDLYDYLNGLRNENSCPVIWTGDLNVAHQEIDIWDSKGNQKSAGHTPQERESFGSFLKQGPWIDAFRHFHPNKIQYTYWSQMQPSNLTQNRGWRLDYFVLSQNMLPYCRAIHTQDFVRGSDHCPVVAILGGNREESANTASATSPEPEKPQDSQQCSSPIPETDTTAE